MDIFCIGGGIIAAAGAGSDFSGKATGVEESDEFRSAVSGLYAAAGPFSGFADTSGGFTFGFGKSIGAGGAWVTCIAKNVKCSGPNCEGK